MKLKTLFTNIILLPTLLLTSCATIVNGTTQRITFTSCPPHANIWVDNCKMGQTPAMIDLTRSDNHLIRIELDGYAPYEILVRKRLSKWVFGNIIFGGVIGLVVDLATGGIYRLTPEQISAHLMATNGNSMTTSDGYIAVTLQPHPSWKKIGQLSPKVNRD